MNITTDPPSNSPNPRRFSLKRDSHSPGLIAVLGLAPFHHSKLDHRGSDPPGLSVAQTLSRWLCVTVVHRSGDTKRCSEGLSVGCQCNTALVHESGQP